MIFLSEQPQTGMNEGTWFTQGMCIKRKDTFCREEDGSGSYASNLSPMKIRGRLHPM